MSVRLLYVADPLCSWCYGFGPELASLVERHPEIGLDLLMGGLRPGTTAPMTQEFKAMLRGHWTHVAQASGQPFSEAILAREDFVYDTEPPCRAVVAARALDPARAFAYMKAVQAAFYRDGIDVTRGDALAGIAATEGYDPATFAAAFASESVRAATRADFERSRELGVAGFPTVALAAGDGLYLVTSGFAPVNVLEERVATILRRIAPALAGSA